MAPKVRITVEDGIIRVVYRGKADFQVTTDMLRKVARIALENKSSLLLFDAREADYQGYQVEAINHAEQGPSLGNYRTFRIALLGPKGYDEMFRYFENVAVNRGYRSRAFTDESEAVAWLRSAL
jgi:hypothetical protein